MKNALTLFYALLFITAMASCARQSSPMGGPKDEEPPQLISSQPENESTNIKPATIELLFNEYIKVENPTQQIIITPRVSKEEIEFAAVRNRLVIDLNQELEDSTTYVFNFQKSVQDITEGNPAANLKLVFSTGEHIDSLRFSGRARHIFPQEDQVVDILIGLYPESDTTDLFTAPPYYVTQADSSGFFEITNIKAGTYRAFAWYDENNSLKAEHRSESYGFLTEPVTIEKDVADATFSLYRADFSELKINRSSPVASNYDVILNKFPVQFEIIHPEVNQQLFYRLKDKNLRLYHRETPTDSTLVRLVVEDSVGFQIDTTIYAKFEPSERALEKLEVTANSGKSFLREFRSRLNFNKPVIQINYDSLFVQYDSAGIIPVYPENVSLPDSTKFTEILIAVNIPDSLPQSTFTLHAADSTFIDVENQWNESALAANYTKLKPENLSEEISGTIETDELPILLQLLNKAGEVVQEQYLTETNTYRLVNIEAGEYRLRAIIDRNKNKRWDPGNIAAKRQPEPVMHFFDAETQTDLITVRGSWTLNGIDIKAEELEKIPANDADPIPN